MFAPWTSLCNYPPPFDLKVVNNTTTWHSEQAIKRTILWKNYMLQIWCILSVFSFWNENVKFSRQKFSTSIDDKRFFLKSHVSTLKIRLHKICIEIIVFLPLSCPHERNMRYQNSILRVQRNNLGSENFWNVIMVTRNRQITGKIINTEGMVFLPYYNRTQRKL